jgi:hypothetical protein
MNARTIQHPGIEIREIDMTEYKDTVTTNNAYVIGFTDRGPIYDYSWITTRSEFINLYGEPQTEAEKYLYYAVQSILTNGGTPIVARMPYDNKQCKSYKALKVKFASIAEDENSDTGFTLYDWNNDAEFTSTASALIDLDLVGTKVAPEGFKTLLETLNHKTVTMTDANGIESIVKPNQLTYSNVLYSLNSDFRFNADVNDDNFTQAYIKTRDNLQSIINYSNIEYHDRSLSSFTTNVSASLSEFKDGLGKLIEEVSTGIITGATNISALSGDFNNISKTITGFGVISANLISDLDLSSASTYLISGIFDNLSGVKSLSGGVTPKINDDLSSLSFPASISGLGVISGSNFVDIFECYRDRLEKIQNFYIRFKKASGTNDIDTEVADALNMLKNYITAKTTKHDKTVSGIINVLSAIPEFSCLTSAEIFYGFKNGEKKPLSAVLNEYTLSASVSGNADFPTSALIGTWETEYPEYCSVASNKPISAWINIALYHNQLSIIEKLQKERGNYIKINGVDPADLGIGIETLNMYLPEGVNYASVERILSGNISGDVTKFSIPEKNFDEYLANIFNDPAFSPVGTKGQAIIDSHLLTTPELSYEYGVYLDSCECNISNEQYDDLVTTNNFTKADMTVSKFGEDINNANFIIVDKQKTIVDGIGSNQGYFITLVDPYDALKMQRLMVNPCQQFTEPAGTAKKDIKYYGLASKYAWKKAFKNEINTLNTLQRIKNADGIWIGEPGKPGKEQLLDSWSMPLAADYYNASISKDLMSLFPSIPLTDVAASANSDTALCTIDKQYSSHIVVAVCKTIVNPSDGKITVSIVEQFFGSLFDEKNVQNGRDLYIGNIINANSNYIEFYRNNYIKPAFGGGMDPEPYNRTPVPQFFIKQSAQLNNAAKMAGIDSDSYDVDNVLSEAELIAQGKQSYQEYIKDLRAANIFIFDKKNTIFYNNHPEAVLTSFSKKEAQKVIANTTGLFGQEAGTTSNIGNNFIIDMDRCISFVKNVDDIPIYFVADAGLSTIAQFCDNVVWDQEANNGNGKWVTQNFDPDNDPDGEDRYIQQYTDVATWRKVVDKLDQISREIRKDCMTIIDAPRMLTLDGSAPKIRRSKPQNNWDDVIGDKLRFISGINSSYTAGYYNWLRTTDEFSGNAFWLPPTCKIIGNYMYLNVLNLPWLAPAGLNYGVITGIHGISHNPSPQEEDQIYMKSWNYIKQYPFDGFIIEGQKTTLTKNSAFNRVNVRTLFLDLERYVYNVARTFKYTVNNQYTREQFVQTIKPKFEDYVLRHGLYDYRIVCNDTNNTPETIDRNELRCAIYLKPARLVEFIMLDFIAAKTGANFDEIIL